MIKRELGTFPTPQATIVVVCTKVAPFLERVCAAVLDEFLSTLRSTFVANITTGAYCSRILEIFAAQKLNIGRIAAGAEAGTVLATTSATVCLFSVCAVVGKWFPLFTELTDFARKQCWLKDYNAHIKLLCSLVMARAVDSSAGSSDASIIASQSPKHNTQIPGESESTAASGVCPCWYCRNGGWRPRIGETW